MDSKPVRMKISIIFLCICAFHLIIINQKVISQNNDDVFKYELKVNFGKFLGDIDQSPGTFAMHTGFQYRTSDNIITGIGYTQAQFRQYYYLLSDQNQLEILTELKYSSLMHLLSFHAGYDLISIINNESSLSFTVSSGFSFYWETFTYIEPELIIEDETVILNFIQHETPFLFDLINILFKVELGYTFNRFTLNLALDWHAGFSNNRRYVLIQPGVSVNF